MNLEIPVNAAGRIGKLLKSIIMKLLLLLVAVSVQLHAQCQDEALIIKGSTKLSRDMTPKQIIDTLNARFSNAHDVKYYKIPPDAASKGWTISKEDNLGSDQTIDYYTITFNRDGFKYYALFAANGRLIRSKHEENIEQLPDAVKFSIKALGEQHPGYKVVSKKYFRNINSSSDEEYYEIIAQKGDEKRSLYYKVDGTLLEIKD